MRFLPFCLVVLTLAGCAERPLLREALPPLTTALAPLPQPEIVETPPVSVPGGAEAPAPPPAPPRPAFLYTRTDSELRLAYADGLGGLLNAAATPSQARRMSAADVRAWLDVLGRTDPASEQFARRSLGPVLREGAVVAYSVLNSNPVGCARMRETLFVAVPEKHQGEARPYVGLIVRDACGGPFSLRCTNVGGSLTESGGRPRVCTATPRGR